MNKTGKNLKAYMEDQSDSFWRFMMFFPVLVNTIMLVNFLLCINAEPIMFAVKSEKNEEDAIKMIKKIYPEEDSKQVYEYLKT
jgi:hypothetical protein